MLFVLVILLTIASVALRITISGLELATAVAVRSDRLARGMIDKMSYKEQGFPLSFEPCIGL